MPIEIINLPTTQQSGNASARPSTAAVNAANRNSDQPQKEDASPPITDTATFTETATQLQEIESKIANIPVVDLERVEALRSRIDESNYKIDVNKLADSILRFESQL